ncbi:MAG: TIM barrel protein [Spirochaetaceae bacterium]|jgi:hydroxypyruvate isomerase|nr:TIM barrel protein [Spirochaetaceae bacterium]
MVPFSANIEMLNDQEPFLERIGKAKCSGFDAIEFWSWENKDLVVIRELCEEFGLFVSSISGDGSDYSLCDDTQLKGYVDYARASFEAAKQVGSSIVVIHSNALSDGKVVDSYSDIPITRLYMNMVKTLLALAPYAEKAGITCVLEPLNRYIDHQGNLLHTLYDAAQVVEVVGSPNIALLYDLYHMQIESGNLCGNYDRFAAHVRHIHVADYPGRHEPGTGEIQYDQVASHILKQGYSGVFAFELSPSRTYEAAVRSIMNLRNTLL